MWTCVLPLLLLLRPPLTGAQELTARDIVARAHQHLRGETSYAGYRMTIENPRWTRTLEMQSWEKGHRLALIRITAPARERGMVFLKIGFEMWNYLPSVEKTIKIPPSMMSQSWMGSDFTNDDLVREASLVEDYDHSLEGQEERDGRPAWRVRLTPRPDAPVVWGKLLVWIHQADYNILREEFFNDRDELINVMVCDRIREMGGRAIPTRYVMAPQKKENHRTTMELLDMQYNLPLEESFFSLQNIRRLR